MRRREVLPLLGSVAAWPLAARAQQPERTWRIAILSGSANDTNLRRWLSALEDGLADLGWKVGSNLRFERRFAAGHAIRAQSLATELTQRTPDLIFTNNIPGALALLGETRTIPIVFLDIPDPLGSGLVSSLARPGGNATGFSNFEWGIGATWIEIIKAIVPQTNRTSLVFNWESVRHVGGYLKSLEVAAKSFAVSLIFSPVHAVAEIDDVMTELTREPGGSVIVIPDIFTVTYRRAIISSAARHHLPAIYPYRVMAAEGGLAAYGPDFTDLYRRAAGYVDRILRGASPSDLPVQRPNKFELVINLKTARTLSLTVPPKLLARANEVIE
jgi:putative tryptophan/tyrosine transport system substrate-binding protein